MVSGLGTLCMEEDQVDNGTLALLIPVLALSIPVLAIASSLLRKHWQFRLEEARLRAGSLDDGTGADLDQLRAEVDQVRRELAELNERVDFSERLLTQRADPSRLPGASNQPPA